ncbi:MAG: nucleotide exchange factor GrpE [Bdellovibrionales bacterium]|nr:nucleotide exchange factor GrpE [Bdellovibrionales bacterium]
MSNSVHAATPETAGANATDESSVDATTLKIQELEAQVKEKENKYLYLYADFENFKKRSQKERADLVKFGWESVARDLLQVIDNFERAIGHMPKDTDKNFGEGLKMISSHFLGILQRQGVEIIDTQNKSFDPNLHEAVAQVPSELPEGTIVKEELRGYNLHGRLLRPARVVISQGSLTDKN